MRSAFNKRIEYGYLFTARVPVNVRLRACRKVNARFHSNVVAVVRRAYAIGLRASATSRYKVVELVIGYVSAVSFGRFELSVVNKLVFVVIYGSFVALTVILQERVQVVLMSGYYKVGSYFVE